MYSFRLKVRYLYILKLFSIRTIFIFRVRETVFLLLVFFILFIKIERKYIYIYFRIYHQLPLMIRRFEKELTRDHTGGGKESTALDHINAMAGDIEISRMKVSLLTRYKKKQIKRFRTE